MKLTTLSARASTVLAGAALALGMTACGSGEPTVQTPPVEVTDDTATNTPDTTEDSQAADNATDEDATEEPDGGHIVADPSDEPGDDDLETTEADPGTHGDSGTDGETEDPGTDGETDGNPGTATDIGADVSPGDIEAAKAGLDRYLQANMPETPSTSTNIPGCPVIDQAVLEQAMADQGIANPNLQGWGAEIEWDEYEDISTELMGVVCGGDSDGNPRDSEFGTASGMVAIDLTGRTDFETLVGSLGVQPDGNTVTICPEDGFCTTLWHTDGLLIGTVLMGEGSTEQAVEGLLAAILPDALATIAQA